MKAVLFTLKSQRDENLRHEKNDHARANEYIKSAAIYKARADEYQRAIDLLEAAATQTTETGPATGK